MTELTLTSVKSVSYKTFLKYRLRRRADHDVAVEVGVVFAVVIRRDVDLAIS